MADKILLANRIVLRSVLPLMKVYYHEVPGIHSGWLKKVDGVIQFSIKGTDTGAYIEFKDGEIDVLQGVHSSPHIHFAFKTADDMNKMFTGKVGRPPSIKGLSNIKLLLKMLPLLLGLTLLLPNKQPKKDDLRLLKVKLTLFMVMNALSQLNKGGDEDMRAWTAKMPDRIFQLSVQPDGPAAYLRVKAGNSKSGRGLYARKAPFIHMIFNGLDGAYKVLAQNKDTVKAMGDGDVRVEGSPEYAGTLGSFMIRVQNLLIPPKVKK